MKVFGLRPYRNGYRGFIEEGDKYIYFSLAAGKYRTLVEFDRGAFHDWRHFAELIGRVYPRSAFVRKPVDIAELTLEELRKVYFS